MSTQSMMRRLARAKGDATQPKHILWLPEGAAELARLKAAGVPDSDIMTVQWLPDSSPEPKREDDNV
jgi:hypothetical protein